MLMGGKARAAFDLNVLTERAKALAATPYREQATFTNSRLDALSYDDYRAIRFRPQSAWWREAGLPFELQFFHVGGNYTRPVRVHELVQGRELPLSVPSSAFDFGNAAPAVAGQAQAELAGFRVHYALNRAGYKDEFTVFLGASYLRAVGAGQHYGSSARGVAIDTAGDAGEDFPAFEAFWIERPARGAKSLTVYALLNGARVTGAYRFELRPGSVTEVAVQARLFLRGAVATLGIAPLTSMFFGGENHPKPLQSLGDFRPEVHDADGLLIETGDGEWLWRPLLNPDRPFTTSFAMQRLRGFGLMQRDRSFASYEDPEARYDQRPSVWVRPEGDWGAGRVELMQFHSPDETNDNVVAYWVPERLPAAGQPLTLSYSMLWQGSDQQSPPRQGRVLQSRLGRGLERPQPGEWQFHIDYAGGPLDGLSAVATPQAFVTSSDNARVLLANVYRNPATKGWRLNLKVQRLDAKQPVELRALLKDGANVLTETWTYALPPE
ncbi:glucan biosynthesis protein D [Methylibium sp. Root1272]|nr:glucan biosynthesis protein D [Methylibium sp. Root1272]